LSDPNNDFANQDTRDIVGAPIWVYAVEDDATELTIEDRVFTGVLNGSEHDRRSIRYTIQEARFFQNQPACPNVLRTDDYPNAGNKEGKVIPTAWGDIRRGRMLLTNADSLSTTASGTAIFLVADPSINEVRAINNLYDKDDAQITTLLTVDLVNCTVSVTKPAGISVSELDKWKWEGEGYDIPGTYNNGLDIIKEAYQKLAQIPYLESTYDQDNWTDETTGNLEKVGISIQSDKGFVERLIEDIATSLQGSVFVLGDGRISWISRDKTADVSDTIESYDQVDIPTIAVDPSQLVSELIVDYSPDFIDKELGLSSTYSVNRDQVVQDYTLDRREPLSPVKTVLVEETDAQSIAAEIMDTSSTPERKIKTSHVNFIKARLLGIVAIDTGEYEESNIEYGELLFYDPDYLNKQETVEIRVVPDYTPS
jgi:hypothetical protein